VRPAVARWGLQPGLEVCAFDAQHPPTIRSGWSEPAPFASCYWISVERDVGRGAAIFPPCRDGRVVFGIGAGVARDMLLARQFDLELPRIRSRLNGCQTPAEGFEADLLA
jgi:hypothetical protein